MEEAAEGPHPLKVSWHGGRLMPKCGVRNHAWERANISMSLKPLPPVRHEPMAQKTSRGRGCSRVLCTRGSSTRAM